MKNFNLINTEGLDRDTALDIAIKAEQRRQFKPTYNGFSVGLSSGTSGNRGLFVTSDQERAEWAGFAIGKMLPKSRRRHRIALFLRANNNLYETVHSPFMHFQYFDLLEPLSELATRLSSFHPTVLIAPASVLRDLSEFSHQTLPIEPDRVISVAEVLDEKDQKIVEKRFQQPLHQIYQSTEGFIGSTCSKGNLHLNENTLIVEKEWVDQASGRFVPIVTDLRRRTQPIVRYRLDDILVQDFETCGCGSQNTRLKKIEGRCDDVLVLPNAQGKNIKVYPDFVRNSIISSTARLDDYKVVQNFEEQLSVYIRPNTPEIRSAINHSLERLWRKLNTRSPSHIFFDLGSTDYSKKNRRVSRNLCG